MNASVQFAEGVLSLLSKLTTNVCTQRVVSFTWPSAILIPWNNWHYSNKNRILNSLRIVLIHSYQNIFYTNNSLCFIESISRLGTWLITTCTVRNMRNDVRLVFKTNQVSVRLRKIRFKFRVHNRSGAHHFRVCTSFDFPQEAV